MPDGQPMLLPKLRGYLNERVAEFDEIPAHRRAVLERISTFVLDREASDRPALLIFVCTHNSRRSHMAQLWARIAAHAFSVPGVETFSGGTEATAFNPRSIAALKRAGLRVEFFTDGKNPTYEVSWEPGMEPAQVFSKLIDESPNPTEDFAAVMTCSAADAGCPVIGGAAERIAVPFDDPKDFDGTEHEAEAYDERCAEIAREMLYVFSKAAKNRESVI